MISFIEGTLEYKCGNCAVVNVCGIGYSVLMPASACSLLPSAGSKVKIYTYMSVKRDSILLYGFLHSLEKELFLLVISVSGVGPRTGLNILSSLSPAQIKAAIENKDSNMLKSVPGLGKKTAERMILELREKIGSLAVTGEYNTVVNKKVSDAVSALVSLGYKKGASQEAVHNAIDDSSQELALEQIIKQALRYL